MNLNHRKVKVVKSKKGKHQVKRQIKTKLKITAPIFILLLLILFFTFLIRMFYINTSARPSDSIFSIRQWEATYFKPGFINIHEHVQNQRSFLKFLNVMDKLNISLIVLLGSPEATFKVNRTGFEKYDENNNLIIDLSRKYEARAIAFCTIDPSDPTKLEKFKNDINRGCRGLKLFSGHSSFYELPLNDSGMDAIYEFCESNRIPVMFHVNFNKFGAEFEEVLKKHPKLTVDCPHFCLISSNLFKLSELMDRYPNLYTDISFGFYAQDGFKRISEDVEDFSNFFIKHQDKIMFGTDIVITENRRKNEDYLLNLTKCYIEMLEKERYGCFVDKEIIGFFNGLNLNSSVLEKIYFKNAEEFLGINDN